MPGVCMFRDCLSLSLFLLAKFENSEKFWTIYFCFCDMRDTMMGKNA